GLVVVRRQSGTRIRTARLRFASASTRSRVTRTLRVRWCHAPRALSFPLLLTPQGEDGGNTPHVGKSAVETTDDLDRGITLTFLFDAEKSLHASSSSRVYNKPLNSVNPSLIQIESGLMEPTTGKLAMLAE